MRAVFIGLALSAALVPAVARADDPNDPAMRTRAARERDREQIRQLNRNQLAYVRQRDARYAQGWADWRAANGDRMADDEPQDRADEGQDRYARQRAQYDRDMAAWRRQVAACRAGDYEACGD